jgi:hypothetical protein
MPVFQALVARLDRQREQIPIGECAKAGFAGSNYGDGSHIINLRTGVIGQERK